MKHLLFLLLSISSVAIAMEEEDKAQIKDLARKIFAGKQGGFSVKNSIDPKFPEFSEISVAGNKEEVCFYTHLEVPSPVRGKIQVSNYDTTEALATAIITEIEKTYIKKSTTNK